MRACRLSRSPYAILTGACLLLCGAIPPADAQQPEPNGQVVFQAGSAGARRTVNTNGELDAEEKNTAKNTLRMEVAPEKLIVDASGRNNVMLPPAKPRSFASWEVFASFAQANVHARVEKGTSKGAMTIVSESVVFGAPLWADPKSKHVYKIGNPVAFFLGGRSGTILVAGRSYSLGTPQLVCLDCPKPAAAAKTTGPVAHTINTFPDTVEQCAGSNCISGHSFNTNLVVFKNIGGETKQESGGFQVHHSFCLKGGFFPWICTTTSGSNHLFVHTTFYSDKLTPGFPNKVADLGIANAFNVESIEQNQSAITINTSSIVQDLNGTCSEHSSDAIGPFKTSTGRVQVGCP
jgi:hypothetical protein